MTIVLYRRARGSRITRHRGFRDIHATQKRGRFGKKTYLYGEKPVGLTMFDRYGNHMSYLSKSDLPKFATANRLKGTDAEYRTVVQGDEMSSINPSAASGGTSYQNFVRVK